MSPKLLRDKAQHHALQKEGNNETKGDLLRLRHAINEFNSIVRTHCAVLRHCVRIALRWRIACDSLRHFNLVY